MKALLKKNWIYWKRNRVMSFCEVTLPILLMIALLIIRISIKRTVLPTVTFNDKVFIDNEETVNYANL